MLFGDQCAPYDMMIEDSLLQSLKFWNFIRKLFSFVITIFFNTPTDTESSFKCQYLKTWINEMDGKYRLMCF